MRVLFIAAMSALLFACSAAPVVQKAMYPPTFAYLEKQDLRTEMWRLAQDTRALDDLLRQDEVAPGEVAEILRSMESTALGLKDRGAVTNHPRLDQNLGRFIDDVKGAREAVEAEPANYFLAGAVSGSCLYCHR